MKRREMRIRRLIGFLVAAAILLFAAPRAATAGPIPFEATRTYDRETSIWFGTLTVVGVPGFSQNFLQLSDRIVDDLINAIDLDPPDARVAATLLPGGVWSLPGFSGAEWVLDCTDPLNCTPVVPPPDNFPAHQNLIDAYTAAATALFGPGTLALSSPVTTGKEYLLATFDTTEVAPVETGDTDNPVLFGLDGQEVTIHNHFVAQPSFNEQNAVWTPSAPAPVPEPATVSLLVTGLAGLGVARRRRRK